jgi:GNAT superfamily N-acetyltransferase
MGRPPRYPGRTLTPADLAALRQRATLVTYLEMTAPPERALRPAPTPSTEVHRAVRPTASCYRRLYLGVGASWTWVARLALDDPALAAIVQDDAVEVQVLWHDGAVAGYVELDFRRPDDVEIAYFGLFPAFIGRGLGSFLLDWAIGHVWSRRPRRLWLHTCDLDHPLALALYQRAGFRIFDRRTEPALAP